jgi:hypothetical protein
LPRPSPKSGWREHTTARRSLTGDSTGRIADIAEIAVIARDWKSKTLPLINADKHGSENQNLTAEKIIDDNRRHSGHFQK